MTTTEQPMTHTPPEVPLWQESVFLVWRDEQRGIGGIHRIGHEVADGIANVWCGVATDDGVGYLLDLDDVPLRPQDRGDRVAAGEHTFTTEDGRLRLRVDNADLRLDLIVDDFYPAGTLWDHTEDVMVAQQSISNHLEGSGRITGSVTLDGREFAVDGFAHRDQSWGPRDWSRIHSHVWVAGSFGPDLSFSCLTMQGADGRFIRGAGVVIDGALSPATFDVVIHMEADGISHRGGVVTLQLPAGPLVLTCEPVNGFVFDHREHVEVDTLCRVTTGDGRLGFCDFEVSQGLRRPVLTALNAITARGLSRPASP